MEEVKGLPVVVLYGGKLLGAKLSVNKLLIHTDQLLDVWYVTTVYTIIMAERTFQYQGSNYTVLSTDEFS